MQCNNRITIATAGSGKTTGIVEEALREIPKKSVLITFTRNNTAELKRKIFQTSGTMPPETRVSTWFTFLTGQIIRPYQRAIYTKTPVRTVAFVPGRSAPGSRRNDVERHYFASEGRIYSDKIAEFAVTLIEKTNGLPLRRLEKIFFKLFIDEVQDLAGYDLELVEHFLQSRIAVRMVGDIRQSTYKTNQHAKNKQFGGAKILAKFRQWESKGLTKLDHETKSFRCAQEICDFADNLYPNLPKATSRNEIPTDHKGVFAVRQSDIEAYIRRYSPQTLRYNRRTKGIPGNPINYGDCKGMTFERVLIFPYGDLREAIKTGDFSKIKKGETTAKVYVAVTRACQSVGFVIPDKMRPANIPIFDPQT